MQQWDGSRRATTGTGPVRMQPTSVRWNWSQQMQMSSEAQRALAATLGRFDEAITLDRRAIELDPLRVATYSNLGVHAYYAGQIGRGGGSVPEGSGAKPAISRCAQALGYLLP